jgi:hypothetical protein
MRVSWVCTNPAMLHPSRIFSTLHGEFQFIPPSDVLENASPAKIILNFGCTQICTNNKNDRRIGDTVLNGLRSHFEHCTDSVMYAHYPERYIHTNPTILYRLLYKNQSVVMLKKTRRRCPLLYWHIAIEQQIWKHHQNQSSMDAVNDAFIWISQHAVILQRLQDDPRIPIIVYHSAPPSLVLLKLLHLQSPPSPRQVTIDVPVSPPSYWKIDDRKYEYCIHLNSSQWYKK